MNRDELGRIVREAWVQYCREHGDNKPSHLTPYDALDEWDKEADCEIGVAVADAVLMKLYKAGCAPMKTLLDYVNEV